MIEEYVCAACGGEFEKTWSDVDAMNESMAIFGTVKPSELAIVCDDCFKHMATVFGWELPQEGQSNG